MIRKKIRLNKDEKPPNHVRNYAERKTKYAKEMAQPTKNADLNHWEPG